MFASTSLQIIWLTFKGLPSVIVQNWENFSKTESSSSPDIFMILLTSSRVTVNRWLFTIINIWCALRLVYRQNYSDQIVRYLTLQRDQCMPWWNNKKMSFSFYFEVFYETLMFLETTKILVHQSYSMIFLVLGNLRTAFLLKKPNTSFLVTFKTTRKVVGHRDVWQYVDK